MRFLITTPCPLLKSRNTESRNEAALPVYRESCSRYALSFGNKIPETPVTAFYQSIMQLSARRALGA